VNCRQKFDLKLRGPRDGENHIILRPVVSKQYQSVTDGRFCDVSRALSQKIFVEEIIVYNTEIIYLFYFNIKVKRKARITNTGIML